MGFMPPMCLDWRRLRSLRRAALAYRQTLRRPSNQTFDVIQGRLCKPAAIGSEVTSRIEANPFADRAPQEIDGEVGIDEAVLLVIQNGADPIARIGGHCYTLVTTGLFALDQRMPQAEPDGTRSVEHCSVSRAGFDQITVTDVFSGKREMRFRSILRIYGNHWKRVPRKLISQFNVGFSLYQCCKAANVLVSGHQMRREMAGIASYIVGHDFDNEIADRYWTNQVRRQSGDVG